MRTRSSGILLLTVLALTEGRVVLQKQTAGKVTGSSSVSPQPPSTPKKNHARPVIKFRLIRRDQPLKAGETFSDRPLLNFPEDSLAQVEEQQEETPTEQVLY